ncbi:site-specific integrase [Rubrivivax gelatinosus]|uniref:site-specific integrase n=1 Tax=Rubrivivax gelatinosus TaxID=28068 RepID=UPI0005C1DD5F|nr:site-specific integrase [Rubrivivax gelatinosus]MBG6078690.1 integrase [Rubrivivax gelatinosus]
MNDTVPRFQGVYLRPDSQVYQFGLVPPQDLAHRFASRWAVRCSLRTKDLREANDKAKALHAEWAARFDAMRREENPQPVTPNPALSGAIAAELRRWVLEADDNMREFTDAPRALLVQQTRRQVAEVLPELAEVFFVPASLRLGTDSATRPPASAARDPLAGMTEAEHDAVARWNAEAAGAAAVDLARGNLRGILPLADAVARSLGLLIEWTTDEGRTCLRECLKAHASATGAAAQRDAGAIVETPAPAALPQPTRPEEQEGHTFAELFEEWRKNPPPDRTRDRTEKTEDTYRTAAGLLASLLPPGRTVETTTRGDARNVLAALREAKSRGELAQNSIVNRVSRFRTLMQQAVAAEWIDRNPFADLRMQRVKTDRDEWSPDELRHLFDDPLFNEYQIPSAARAGRDSAYWLPLLGLYTGARISELAQLRIDDLEHTPAAGWVLHIREDEEEGLRTKNAPSVRSVPVHPELLRLGLVDYRTAIEQAGATRLWPGANLTTKNGAGGEVSKWFGAYKKAKGFGKDRVFHCFRNTLETRLRALGVPQSHIDRIAGHAGNNGTGDDYSRLKPADVRPSLERLSFPTLNLPRVFTAPAWTPRASRRR